MQLSKFSDYALRVLIYLGSSPDQTATIHGIATRYGISHEHLRKVVHRLSQSGWIESRRGRGGGLHLVANPAAVRIGAVIRDTEENMHLVECFDSTSNTCRIAGVCRLQGMLGEALEAFLTVLDGYTLADITSGHAGLSAMLGFTQQPHTMENKQ